MLGDGQGPWNHFYNGDAENVLSLSELDSNHFHNMCATALVTLLNTEKLESILS